MFAPRSTVNVSILAAALSVGGCFQLSGCKSLSGIEEGAAITKVKKYHLDLSSQVKATAADKMINHEYERRLFGAVSQKDREAREGFYFTVFWTTDNSDVPAIVRLEYLLEQTNDKVHVQEDEVAAGQTTNVTEFSVLGDEYAEFGEVLAYRISVHQQGKIVADHQSYLWE
jgi:hypothetical protein